MVVADLPKLTTNQTLLDSFEQYFDVIAANSSDLIQKAYGIRYEVYCIERGFEDSTEHPDGLEIDEFDPRAIHSLLIHRQTREAVGTVRIVLPLPEAPDRSFAIQRVTDHPTLKDGAAFPVESMAEISRFSISKHFRRRANDSFFGPDPKSPLAPHPGERRVAPPLRLGLMQAIVTMSAELGLTHWCAVMEPTLLRILAACSIHFEPLGPMVEYHGRRQPCYAKIETILTRLEREQPEVWDVVTNRGVAWDLLRQKWRARA